jgi:hypothetical protein
MPAKAGHPVTPKLSIDRDVCGYYYWIVALAANATAEVV